jgi:hypothetical protein
LAGLLVRLLTLLIVLLLAAALLLLLLLIGLLLTAAALLLIALIGHQVAPGLTKGKRSHRSDVPSQRCGKPSLPDPINGRLGATARGHSPYKLGRVF